MSAPLLIGYDGTDGGEAALTEGLRLAKALGAEVVIGYAVHVNPMGGEVRDFAAALEEQARAVLDKGVARAQQEGVPARGELVRGRVRDALSELASVVGAQMIVVGPAPHRLIGRSPVPVLAVPGA